MRRRPRESGGPLLVRNTMDSRFRGNDVNVTLARARRTGAPGEHYRFQSKAPFFQI